MPRDWDSEDEPLTPYERGQAHGYQGSEPDEYFRQYPDYMEGHAAGEKAYGATGRTREGDAQDWQDFINGTYKGGSRHQASRHTAIQQDGMQCLYCGAVDPDSEDQCESVNGGRHTLISYTDKQGQGQGQGKGPTENNYKDDTHDPADDDQLKASASFRRQGRWAAAWGQTSEGRIGPRSRIHAVDPFTPDRTACGRPHGGLIEPEMAFGGEIVGHDHPFACAQCSKRLRAKTAHGLMPDESTRVKHCPACGAGDVWGGSSGDVHCDSCGMTFTVQAQPEYPQMPQNLNGMPLDINGDMDPAGGPGAPGDEEDLPPGEDDEEGSPEDEEDQGKDQESSAPPFPPKQSSFYMTHQGNVVDRDNLINYLAIRHAYDPNAMIKAVRARNTAR